MDLTVVDGWYCGHGVFFVGLCGEPMVREKSRKDSEPNVGSFVPQWHGGFVSASCLVNR